MPCTPRKSAMKEILTMFLSRLSVCVILLHALSCVTVGQTPEIVDTNLKLELFAESPDIVTPIGCCIDRKGRLLAIESHTHKRGDYDGPEKDRIRLIEDTDGDGKADSFRTFYEGTEFTMSLARGDDDWIYVATRARVFRIRDTDGDDVADEEQLVAELQTTGVYPHNGLSGLMPDGKGKLYFGLGENLGHDFRLVGHDGEAHTGSGEGGIFRCDLNGDKLERIATGFWNPFGLCMDRHDRIFAVGNDSDGRPPCRLIQVFEASDYGFQFRYGRAGRHPLQAWDGELPGTLPMIAGTGEAPCEMMVLNGRLWVAGWGDNQIERYELVPKGASFSAKRDIPIRGDRNFRPVGFAKAPDGSVFVTDWVDRSYPVHGKGRIWRMSYRTEPQPRSVPPLSNLEKAVRNAAGELDWEAFDTRDPVELQFAVIGLTKSPELMNTRIEDLPESQRRLGLLMALRWKLDHAVEVALPPPIDILTKALDDSDPAVRLYAVRWVADAEIGELQKQVERQLADHSNATEELFLGTIACLDVLEHGPKTFDPRNSLQRFYDVLGDANQSPAMRAIALRMLPTDEDVWPEAIESLLTHDNETLQRAAVRWLVLSKHDRRTDFLRRVIGSDASSQVKADAEMGIRLATGPNGVSSSPASQDHPDAKDHTDAKDHPDAKDHTDAKELDAWMKLVGSGGDADAGWRTFFGH